MVIISILLLALPPAVHSIGYDLNQLPTRSVIAHMFEWKFDDIASECERWLGPKGYGAVQVNAHNKQRL